MYIVAYWISNATDYEVFETRIEAFKRYQSILSDPATHSVSLAAVMDSTDYGAAPYDFGPSLTLLTLP